jgi:hypothetical protein
MTQFSSVLVFGDSTSAGWDTLDTEDYKQLNKNSFGNLLAERLNIPCKNYARAGTSNQRNLRLLANALVENPNSLVLFCYTGLDRAEFFVPDLDNQTPQDDDGYVPMNPIKWESAGLRYSTMVDAYYKHLYYSTRGYNNYTEYNMLITVQSICKEFAADFLHIFQYPKFIDTSAGYQQKLYQAIDKSHIVPWHNTLLDNYNTIDNGGFSSVKEFCDSNNWSYSRRGVESYSHDCKTNGIHHISSDAHKHVEEKLFNFLKNKNDSIS